MEHSAYPGKCEGPTGFSRFVVLSGIGFAKRVYGSGLRPGSCKVIRVPCSGLPAEKAAFCKQSQKKSDRNEERRWK